VGQCLAQIQLGLENEHAEHGMVMTIVMPIIVVALLQNTSITIIMVAQISIVIMAVVIVVKVKS
jgi:hypothetical protein